MFHFSRSHENRSIKNWTISVPLFTPCNIKREIKRTVSLPDTRESWILRIYNTVVNQEIATLNAFIFSAYVKRYNVKATSQQQFF